MTEGNCNLNFYNVNNQKMKWYSTTTSGCTTNWEGMDGTIGKENMVPVLVVANEEVGVVVVKWADGDEIKVTCDVDDKFNVESAIAHATLYKIFGGKNEYKRKWRNVISHKIDWKGNTHDAECTELERMDAVREERSEKRKQKKENLLRETKRKAEKKSFVL